MQYILFNKDHDLKIAILATNIGYDALNTVYVEGGLALAGLPEADRKTIAYKIPMIPGKTYKAKAKALSVSERREYFNELLPMLTDIGVEYIIVTEPNNYKTLTGMTKATHEAGTLRTPCLQHFPSHANNFKVAYAPNHKMVFYDPVKTKKNIGLASEAIVNHIRGGYTKPGDNIILHCEYPTGYNEIERFIRWLRYAGLDLSCDIETFSLEMHDAGIASIAFAWGDDQGASFQVDPAPGVYNFRVRKLLADLFYWISCQIKWHNAAFDLTVLIYQLTRNNPYFNSYQYSLFDTLASVGKMHCTKIISYLATNSCAGNKLSLKEQAVEFAGNYAVEDIKDVTKILVQELLEYNLVDALSTRFVFDKNYPKMVQDQQEDIYDNIFIPSLTDIIDMQLNGLPVDMNQVKIARNDLEVFQGKAVKTMLNNSMVLAYTHHLKEQYVDKMHTKWKKKRITVSEVDLELNPGSALQLQGLLFDSNFMDLPVVATTDTDAPSTKGKHLKAMKNHTKNPDTIAFLDALIDYKDSAILLSTFIPALENARKAPDGNYYMHGNFNLGGTVSGRLSSSDPNLQNIPSKSRLAKYIKQCIRAPQGWIFCGLDFDSLEDKISALLTKDPNKIKVYTDGYDGHSLRAYSYFGDQMPDIDPNDVASINSIAKRYSAFRQNSKAPTFLLTYGGTYHGLKANCGFTEVLAKQIELQYHTLYKVSDEWVASKINGATKDGYITCAFGLRVRTPILHQTILGNKKTPSAAKAEARTAGNALGQSWGLLNNRAASEFMAKVRADHSRRKDIKICCQIHDAQYYLVRDCVHVMKWFNDNIVEAVSWQQHPDIAHKLVKLSGKTEIFYPTWAEDHQIPNGASEDEIREICTGILDKLAA